LTIAAFNIQPHHLTASGETPRGSSTGNYREGGIWLAIATCRSRASRTFVMPLSSLSSQTNEVLHQPWFCAAVTVISVLAELAVAFNNSRCNTLIFNGVPGVPFPTIAIAPALDPYKFVIGLPKFRFKTQ
jgi:hypothetical protein